MPWPLAFRQKIIATVRGGKTPRQAAYLHMVHHTSITRWMQRPRLEADEPASKKLFDNDVLPIIAANPTWGPSKLARHLGVNEETARDFMHRHDISGRGAIVYDHENFKKFMAENSNMKAADIGKKLGIHKDTVTWRCRELGIPMRIGTPPKVDKRAVALYLAENPKATQGMIAKKFDCSKASASRYRSTLQLQPGNLTAINKSKKG